MIQLDFIKSIDQDIIGIYMSCKNLLTLGYSYRNDIILRDKSLEQNILEFNLSERGLSIHNNNLNTFYHLNGKKYFGKKTARVGDEVKIKTTTLIIKEILFIPEKTYTELIKENNQNASNNASVENILNLLKKEIYHIEREMNAKK